MVFENTTMGTLVKWMYLNGQSECEKQRNSVCLRKHKIVKIKKTVFVYQAQKLFEIKFALRLAKH